MEGYGKTIANCRIRRKDCNRTVLYSSELSMGADHKLTNVLRYGLINFGKDVRYGVF